MTPNLLLLIGAVWETFDVCETVTHIFYGYKHKQNAGTEDQKEDNIGTQNSREIGSHYD